MVGVGRGPALFGMGGVGGCSVVFPIEGNPGDASPPPGDGDAAESFCATQPNVYLCADFDTPSTGIAQLFGVGTIYRR